MKKSLLSCVCLLVYVLSFAEPISSDMAKEIASNYLNKNKDGQTAMSLQIDPSDKMDVQAYQYDSEGNALMYVVNNAGGGYVIVSGDDRMRLRHST